MSLLLILLLVYFGAVLLWAGPRLCRLLHARLQAMTAGGGGCRSAGAVTIHCTMPIRRKTAGD